jgi:mannose-1-phosphate guanylyltransferase / mannose-6-phosphate isomerase
MAIIPIILSGGAGTRLWPLSRETSPKQFLRFGSEESLFVETLRRCTGPIFDQRPIIVSGEAQRFLVAEDLRTSGVVADIVLEPARKDSCAAIVAGCLQALLRSPDAMVLVLAADHKIPDANAFAKAIDLATEDAAQGYLVTFGVHPKYPATGYGYIKPGVSLRSGGSSRVEKFVEKPDVVRAQTYMRDGSLWNSGNFLFQANVFLREADNFVPDIVRAVTSSFEAARREEDFTWLGFEEFSKTPRISIDFAVMEKTDRAAVFPVDYEWSDVGTWDAVHALLPHDENGNALEGHSFIVNGSNNLVKSTGRFTALVDVDDIVVVVGDDSVLVTKRGRSESVKKLVGELKAKNVKEAE